MQNFPFKTLIWAIFGLIVTFLFKQELSDFLARSEEITVFGISASAKKKDIPELRNAYESYEREILLLADQLNSQKTNVINLQEEVDGLIADLTNCGDAAEKAKQVLTNIDKVAKVSSELWLRSDVLAKQKALEIPIKSIIKKPKNSI